MKALCAHSIDPGLLHIVKDFVISVVREERVSNTHYAPMPI